MIDLPAEHFDLDRLAELDSLPGDLVADLMQIFQSTTPDQLAELKAAREQGSSELFWRAAHALKSSSLNIGAIKLAEYCLNAERLGKASNMQDLDHVIAQIDAEVSLIHAVFEGRLKTIK